MNENRKKIVILGSTGSIGENAVKVVQHLRDEFYVTGIAAATNSEKLAEQAEQLGCEYVAIADSSKAGELSALPRLLVRCLQVKKELLN